MVEQLTDQRSSQALGEGIHVRRRIAVPRDAHSRRLKHASKSSDDHMRQTFFGSALVCLAACGGKPQTCTVALSGAQTGTYDCSPAVLAWASSVDTFNF